MTKNNLTHDGARRLAGWLRDGSSLDSAARLAHVSLPALRCALLRPRGAAEAAAAAVVLRALAERYIASGDSVAAVGAAELLHLRLAEARREAAAAELGLRDALVGAAGGGKTAHGAPRNMAPSTTPEPPRGPR